MARYLALVDGAAGTWGVVIPDFPGCHGGGATPEAAVTDATRALREFAADIVDNGEALPAPSSWDEVTAASKRGGLKGGFVYVPLLLDKKRSVRANISLDAGLLEEIDRAAAEHGLTRSAFLASAALEKIADGGR
jgi:predicted RNase H-like HicB family nuclease